MPGNRVAPLDAKKLINLRNDLLQPAYIMGMMQRTGPVFRAFALSCAAIACSGIATISVWSSSVSQDSLHPSFESASALPGPLDGGPSNPNPKPKAGQVGSCTRA